MYTLGWPKFKEKYVSISHWKNVEKIHTSTVFDFFARFFDLIWKLNVETYLIWTTLIHRYAYYKQLHTQSKR